MKIAREMNGLSGLEAAELLGYANSSKLSKIEHASDPETIPAFLPYKASIVYQVSTDFLYGISEDWQRDPVTAQEQQIKRALEEVTSDERNSIRELFSRLSTVEQAVSVVDSRFSEIRSTFNLFVAKNESFPDLKLGAKLCRLIDESTCEVAAVGRKLSAYHASNQ